MEGKSHHAVGQVERLLDAVAVVHVDVHIEYTVLVLEQFEDRKHYIIYVAEARSLALFRVVQATFKLSPLPYLPS